MRVASAAFGWWVMRVGMGEREGFTLRLMRWEGRGKLHARRLAFTLETVSRNAVFQMGPPHPTARSVLFHYPKGMFIGAGFINRASGVQSQHLACSHERSMIETKRMRVEKSPRSTAAEGRLKHERSKTQTKDIHNRRNVLRGTKDF